MLRRVQGIHGGRRWQQAAASWAGTGQPGGPSTRHSARASRQVAGTGSEGGESGCRKEEQQPACTGRRLWKYAAGLPRAGVMVTSEETRDRGSVGAGVPGAGARGEACESGPEGGQSKGTGRALPSKLQWPGHRAQGPAPSVNEEKPSLRILGRSPACHIHPRALLGLGPRGDARWGSWPQSQSSRAPGQAPCQWEGVRTFENKLLDLIISGSR